MPLTDPLAKEGTMLEASRLAALLREAGLPDDLAARLAYLEGFGAEVIQPLEG